MSLAQIKQRPQLKGHVRSITSARRGVSRRALSLRRLIAYTNATGVMAELYKYGPYGDKNVSNGDSWTGSRFMYTGQVRLDGGQLYYYKARVYDPKMGRFLQTDPIGSKDDLDLYAYTGGDPVNKSDPSGLAGCGSSMSSSECASAMKAQEQARQDIKTVKSALKGLTNERAAVASGSQKELSTGARAIGKAVDEVVHESLPSSSPINKGRPPSKFPFGG